MGSFLDMQPPFILTAVSPRNDSSHLPSLSRTICLRPSLRPKELISTRGLKPGSANEPNWAPSLQSDINYEAIEVENLNEWNTQNDMQYKLLEAQFKRLYSTLEAESTIRTRLQKRISSSRDITFQKRSANTSHETKREKLKTLFALSRQYKEFEDRLEREYSGLEAKLRTLKEAVKIESTQVCDLRANVHKLMAEKGKLLLALDHDEAVIKGLRMQNLAAFLSKKSALQARKDETTANYSTAIAQLEAKVEETMMAVESKRADIETYREKMRAIKTGLVKHYTQILIDGVDCRSLGLRWAVLKLWKFDFKVTFDMLPSYLDRQSAEVILSLACKEKEAETLQNCIKNMSKASHVENQNTSNKTLNDIKTRLVRVRSDNITRQKTMTMVDRFTKETKVVKEIITDDDEDNSRFHLKVKKDWKRIKQAEDQLLALRSQIEELQSAEVKRISHDYFSTGSGIGPEKDKSQYIAAIVGYDAVDRYMHLLRKDEKEVKLLQEHTQTFTFAKP